MKNKYGQRGCGQIMHMNGSKHLIVCLTAILVFAVGILMAAQLGADSGEVFFVTVESDGYQENISCWMSDEGHHYVFLPTYADMNKTYIHLRTNNPVSIDGIPLSDGMSCSAFSTDVPYSMCYQMWGQLHTEFVTFVHSASVAAMYIDTASGSMEYIHQNKENKETGKLRLYTADGALNHTGELESIKGRGNSTWQWCEKKPYGIKFIEDASLLGIGKARRWVLLANAEDPSQVKNKAVYDFANQIGLRYSPESEWIDLYLNGKYAGLYLLCERNEIHEERVAIDHEEGILLSREIESRLKEQNLPHIITEANQAFRVHNTENAVIDMDKAYSVIQSVENALLAEDGIDPVTGKSYLQLIDLESWAKKYLIEEVFGNDDGCYISQYFYFQTIADENIVFAGPVWDYDIAMGPRQAWQFAEPRALYASRAYAADDIPTPWFHALCKKEVFQQYFRRVYQEQFLPELQNLYHAMTNEYAEKLKQAGKSNQIRWSISTGVQEEIEYIVDFLQQRTAFLSELWIEEKQFLQVCANPNCDQKYYAFFAVEPGQCLTTLPQLEDRTNQRFVGWYNSATNQLFSTNEPIMEDTKLYAKWETTQEGLVKKILKLLPLGVIACMGAALLLAEVMRWGKAGERAWRRK